MGVARSITLVVAVGLTLTATAASRIRLMMGTGWNRASEDLKKMMQGPKFKMLLGGKYSTEFVEAKGNPNPPDDTMKCPTIYVLDEKGRCYFVFENVPYNYPGERLFKTIDKVNERRQQIEKGGMATPDECGKLLLLMEKFVGGPRRVISRGFYEDVFQKLQKLDPQDQSGWIRHFTLGSEYDKSNQADGLELVIKANEYREKKDFQGGQAWLDREFAKNRKHLTPEQTQGLLMAKFALYREDPAHRDEMIKLLEKVAAYNEDTLWGTAAVGWLKLLGQPPLSTYWGWRKGDFAGKFNTKVHYGVKYSFRKPGDYTIAFDADAGAPLGVSEVIIMAGEEEVAKLTKKSSGNAPFTVTIPRLYAGRCTDMIVKGTTILDTTGRFTIHRQVLKPRKIAGAK